MVALQPYGEYFHESIIWMVWEQINGKNVFFVWGQMIGPVIVREWGHSVGKMRVNHLGQISDMMTYGGHVTILTESDHTNF